MVARIIERKGQIGPDNCPARSDKARFSKNHPKADHDKIGRKIDELAPLAAAATVRALSEKKHK